MRLSVKIVLALCVLSVCSRPALAFPRVWTLTNVVFDDGGTASGSFIYDADLNQYSNVDVTTTTGSTLTGTTFHFVGSGLPPGPGQVLFLASNAADLTGTRGLALFFAPPLTNLGGTVSIAAGQEASCLDATCSLPNMTAPRRTVVAGAVTSIVPAPALSPMAVVLLAVMLLLCGVRGLPRRKAPTPV